MIRRGVVGLLAATLLVLATGPAPVAAGAISSFRVINSPFTSDAVSTRHAAGIRLKLSRKARVTLIIEAPGGAAIRRVAINVLLRKGGHRWSWAGKTDGGVFAPDGDYIAHLTVRNTAGTEERTLALRKGMPPVYPANPGAITVLVNPGHGGYLTGATSQGLIESEINLDIGLRLRRLLQAAGVRVVMTRTADVHVPDPEFDVNGDGVIGPTEPKGDDWDGLAYRLDVGNAARADVHIFNHNNYAGCACRRGTETFTGMQRTWTTEGLEFATFIQAGQISQLDTFRSAAFAPLDLGVRDGQRYYTLSPYSPSDAPLEPRPALMPTVLTESLFVNHPVERELLRRAAVREAIAIGLYMGIVDYLAARDYGVRYELLSSPSPTAPGGPADYQLRLTNTGNLTSAGWQLELHSVPAVPFYDGSGAIGDPMGVVDIPDGLGPGQSTTLTVQANAPPTAGEWLVKADVWIGGPDRPYLSQRGVVSLQVPLTTAP